MGLFGTKKKVYMSTLSSKLTEEVPTLITQSIRTAIRKGDSIGATISQSAMQGLGIRAQQMYHYAAKNYTYGLPSGTSDTHTVSDTAVRAAIEKELNSPVYIVSSIRSRCVPLYWAQLFLHKKRNWEPTTDLVKSPPSHNDHPVYFSAIKPLGDNRIRIIYDYTDPRTGNPGSFTEDITTTIPMKLSKDYFHVIYRKVTRDSIIPIDHYWLYEIGSKKYPTLEIKHSIDVGSPFLPVVPIRLYNENKTTNENSAYFKSAKKTIERVGLDLKRITKNVLDNPNIDSIDHAYIVFGCHPKDSAPSVKLYMHELFKHLQKKTKTTAADYLHWQNKRRNARRSRDVPTPSYTTLWLSDANLEWSISYMYIDEEITKGKVGKGKLNECEVFLQHGDKHTITTGYYADDILVVRRQISRTQVSTMHVCGLNHNSYLYHGRPVTYDIRSAMEGNDNEGFVLPIDINVMNNMGAIQANDLMNNSMRIVFNSWEKRVLRWYETELFRIVLVIAAIVYAVYTGQWEAVAAALAVGVVAAAILIAEYILISIVIKLAVTVIARAISPELAMIIAAAATIYGMSAGTLPLNLTSLQITQISSELANESIKAEAKELQDDAEDWMADAEAKTTALEELQEEVYNVDAFTQSLLLTEQTQKYTTVLAETWDTYYMRNINLPANSFAVLDAIDMYVDLGVMLPSADETLQRFKIG